MAWPYDARDFTFANGLYVPSATLNEIQDRIIDVYESHDIIDLNMVVSQAAAGTDLGWYYDYSAPEKGLVNKDNLRALYINLRYPNQCILNAFRVKYYNAHGSSATIYVKIFKIDPSFATAGNAPSIVGGTHLHQTSKSVSATSWDVISGSGLDIEIESNYRYYMEIIPNGTTVGDYCAAIEVDTNYFG